MFAVSNSVVDKYSEFGLLTTEFLRKEGGLVNEFKSGFVAIIGRPNVGKSTLLNQLVGQKLAIMSNKPQTTRNKISGVLNRDNAQIVFIDTPGIHKPKHRLGELMVKTSMKSLSEVDCILLIVDATQEVGKGDEYILANLSQVKTPVILVINKIDLLPPNELLPVIDQWKDKYDFQEIVPVSALRNNNTAVLVDLLLDLIPLGPKYYPENVITDQPERLLVAELIREKVLHRTREEVPHSIAVMVENIERKNNDLIFVSASVFVERDSQKKILIGKNGSLLKEIGIAARGELEALLGNKVFLDLWVKVKKDWRNHEGTLRNLGFYEK
jgi:GTP-binding protein Era